MAGGAVRKPFLAAPNPLFISLHIRRYLFYISNLEATRIRRIGNKYHVCPPTGFWSGNQGNLYMHKLPVNTLVGTETRLDGKK